METTALKGNITARFEFRVFGPDLEDIRIRLFKLGSEKLLRQSSEIYILSKGRIQSNTKIRHDLIDIKKLLRTEQGLEQWSPLMKGAFPLNAEILKNEVCPELGFTLPERYSKSYKLEAFLNELIAPDALLKAVNVEKERTGFNLKDCITEFAEILIDGIPVQTLAVESTEISNIFEVMRDLGIQGMKNTNYPRAIRRIIGWDD